LRDFVGLASAILLSDTLRTAEQQDAKPPR